jgi:cardiolipin synthase
VDQSKPDLKPKPRRGGIAMSWLHSLYLEAATLLGVILLLVTIPWVLMTKKESTSAVAWCLLVFFLPILGTLFFVIFGYQHVEWPLTRKRRHKKHFQRTHHPGSGEVSPGPAETVPPDTSWAGMARLAERFGAFPVAEGNHVTFYHEGRPAFDAILEAVRAARHHVHLEYFIFRAAGIGRELLDLLTQKAREGVEVRLLYDAMGSRGLHRADLEPLRAAGGKCSPFLPLSLLRRRIQVNLRDHRKILVVDGQVAFTGGLNIGDEYLGLNKRLGFWRDTHLRLEGPAVAALQRVFIEGWDFAAGELLQGAAYYPPPRADGPYPVQVVPSGPDQALKSIREMYFAAILRARERLWIASPYFVPDAGLLDALCLAGYLGVDVRLLCQYHPDKWIPWFTGRFYFAEVLDAGVKVYQYTKGMMHSKVVLVDGEWASVGTANLDNRSLHLNFEVNCLLYSPEAAAQLEEAYRHDLEASICLERAVYAKRPFAGRLMENACRLLSPVL